MAEQNGRQPVVVRTERGLVVAGTRTTLYQIMDHIVAGWPRNLIRDWMDLTDEQIDRVMQYIHEHRVEFDAEYQEVLQQAEEERRYWEERNRERFAEIAANPRTGHPELRAKLAAIKANLQQS